MRDTSTPPPNEGWVESGTCGGRWSRVRDGIFETWQPQPTPGTIVGGFIYSMPPTKVLSICSTCHQPIDTPGCCTSPESKDAYPHGFHTVYGGVGQAKP